MEGPAEFINATGLTLSSGSGRLNSTSSSPVSPKTLSLLSVSICTIWSCAEGDSCDIVRRIVGGFPENLACSNCLFEICEGMTLNMLIHQIGTYWLQHLTVHLCNIIYKLANVTRKGTHECILSPLLFYLLISSIQKYFLEQREKLYHLKGTWVHNRWRLVSCQTAAPWVCSGSV